NYKHAFQRAIASSLDMNGARSDRYEGSPWNERSIGSPQDHRNIVPRNRRFDGFHRLEKLISSTPFSSNFATTSVSVSSRNSFVREARRRVLTPSSSASS